LEPSRDERALVSLAAAGARRLIEALPYPALLVALDDTLLAHNEPALRCSMAPAARRPRKPSAS